MDCGALRINAFSAISRSGTALLPSIFRVYFHYIKKPKQEQAPDIPGLAATFQNLLIR
jgi:hypothetical protein